jgi:hypothetical protein
MENSTESTGEHLPNVQTQRAFSKNRALWICSIPLVFWTVLWIAAQIQPKFNFNKWDNYVYFTPIITQAHDLWLHGQLPYWNPYQHMGEPILTVGTSGPFYLPYTLSLMIVRLLGLESGSLMFVVVVLHIALAGVGWFFLLRILSVRPSLAFLTALSACFAGHVMAWSTILIFMLALFSLLPWILWGMVKLLAEGKSVSGALALVFGLASTAYIGHAQMWVYVWVFTVLFFLLFGLWVYRQPRRMLQIVILFLIIALLSTPALLPIYNAVQFSTRSEPFSMQTFLSGSILPATLAGWLLPLFRVWNGFLLTPSSIMGYQGGWVLPAIAGVLLCQFKRKHDSSKGGENGAHLTRAFAAALALSVFFCLLALGRYGFIYPWTHWIPVWSSFRWPYKFFFFSQAALILSAGLAIEICARALTGKSWLRIVIGLVVLIPSLCFLIVRASGVWLSFFGLICLFSGLASMVIVGWADRRWARSGLLALAFGGAVGIVALCHVPDWNTFRGELWGKVGAKALGIDNDYRVLPVSLHHRWINGEYHLQFHGHCHSATGNGYYSATGTSYALLPRWYSESLPADIEGVLSHSTMRTLLPSHLLRCFNVRYLLASPNDKETLQMISEVGGYRPLHILHKVIVYENQDALPRAYFASHAYKFSRNAFEEGMLRNKSPLRSAYVQDWKGPERLPEAKVLKADWKAGRVKFLTDAPQGGLLVISMSYFPDWEASVDGRPAKVLLVNSRVQGVIVPPGTKTVVLEYYSSSLHIGFILAAGGCLLLILWLVFMPVRTLPRGIPAGNREPV